MAVEAVLLLLGKINDEDEETASMRLLVPSKVIGCIIGKSGSIINEIRKRTKADVRISKGEKPKCADASDELVEVCSFLNFVRYSYISIFCISFFDKRNELTLCMVGGWRSCYCERCAYTNCFEASG